jgi:hypothetical protein
VTETARRDPAGRSRNRRQTWAVTGLFILLTAAMTWPQVLHLSTRAAQHHDVYFNLWRLRWVAHALANAPATLFDGNIFYPERRALTLSDAMLVEGVVGAPLLWLGLPPVLVHNLLLLGAIVASAVGIFVLARHLTGSAGAGIVAGVVFAFVPYRFEHYMHMELQWIMWVPWAFWSLQRTFETASPKYGLLTGIFVSLQMLSCIYYGAFLVILLGVVTLCLAVAALGRRLLPVAAALAAGALLAATVCGAYALPYLATKDRTGGRSEHEVQMFSARPSSYLVATPDNLMWGHAFAGRGRPERRLFPGLLAVILAVTGLLLRAPPPIALACLAGAILAFELSLGLSGYSFRLLYDHVPLFHGFRAIARMGIFTVFFVAVLAAFGYSALSEALGRRGNSVLAFLVVAILLMEYRVSPLVLVPYTNHAPPLYAWLAGQPRGVVAELPMAPRQMLSSDAEYAYMSTFHWQPIVNGYSGFHPASYLGRAEALRHFPNDSAIARLRADGVGYLVLHLERFAADQRVLMLEIITRRHRMAELGRFSGPEGEAVVFRVR